MADNTTRAFPLMAAELAHFAPAQRKRGWRAVLGPADVQGCGFEVDLLQRRSTTSAALRPCRYARSTMSASRWQIVHGAGKIEVGIVVSFDTPSRVCARARTRRARAPAREKSLKNFERWSS